MNVHTPVAIVNILLTISFENRGKRYPPEVTHSASTMKKSSHANPDLVSRRDQKRNATVTMANKVKTTARAYILPGDSSVAKNEDNIFVCELDGHFEMGIREYTILSSKNTNGDQALVIQRMHRSSLGIPMSNIWRDPHLIRRAAQLESSLRTGVQAGIQADRRPESGPL